MLPFILESTFIKKAEKAAISVNMGSCMIKKSWGMGYFLFNDFNEDKSCLQNKYKKFLGISHSLFSVFESYESVLEPKRRIFSMDNCERLRQPFDMLSVPSRCQNLNVCFN